MVDAVIAFQNTMCSYAQRHYKATCLACSSETAAATLTPQLPAGQHLISAVERMKRGMLSHK
jgi:hypothetical protein